MRAPRVVRAYLPDRIRETAKHLRARMPLIDLCLRKGETGFYEPSAESPSANERYDKRTKLVHLCATPRRP